MQAPPTNPIIFFFITFKPRFELYTKPMRLKYEPASEALHIIYMMPPTHTVKEPPFVPTVLPLYHLSLQRAPPVVSSYTLVYLVIYMTPGRCLLSIFCSRGLPPREVPTNSCRANMARVKQPRPDSAPGFQFKVLPFKLFFIRSEVDSN